MLFCQYKNIFGEPGVGLHATRLFGMAQIDLVMTIIAAILIATYLKANMLKTFGVLFAIGTVLHILFCVNTSFVNNVLGIKF